MGNMSNRNVNLRPRPSSLFSRRSCTSSFDSAGKILANNGRRICPCSLTPATPGVVVSASSRISKQPSPGWSGSSPLGVSLMTCMKTGTVLRTSLSRVYPALQAIVRISFALSDVGYFPSRPDLRPIHPSSSTNEAWWAARLVPASIPLMAAK